VGCSALLDLDGDFARDASPGGDTGTDAGTADTGTTDAATDAAAPLCMPPQPPVVSGCNGGGSTMLFVVSRIGVGVADGSTGHTPGFNIDGCNTEADGPTGCGHMDDVYDIDGNGVIEGLESGIDNQLAPYAPTLAAYLDLQGLVQEGKLLWLVEVSGVNDIDNDDCVDVAILRGVVPTGELPAVDEGGSLEVGQVFDIDDRSYDSGGQALAFARGRIDNSRLRIGPVDLPLALRTDQGRWLPNLFDAQLVVDGATGTFEGVLGGGFDIEAMVNLLAAASDTGRDGPRVILEAMADLEPDENNENCEQVSAGFIFETVAAVRGTVVDARSCEWDWPLAWWVDAGEDCKWCMCASCDGEVLACLEVPACKDVVTCALEHGCADEICVQDNCGELGTPPEAIALYACLVFSGCDESCAGG
jgi:hypothetical protein